MLDPSETIAKVKAQRGEKPMEDQDKFIQHKKINGEDFTEMVHPGAPTGLIGGCLQMREQDEIFEPAEYYAVVFFPRVDFLGPATAKWPSVLDTISNSPEASITKFMDRIVKSESWESYAEAGHKVRKILISDLGDI